MVVGTVHTHAECDDGKRMKYSQNCKRNPMDLLCFVQNVARHYLSFSCKGSRQSCDRARNPGSVPRSVVSDRGGHFPNKLEKQQHCAVCHARVRWRCKKCLKTLCVERDCFEKFHTEK